ncbi:hypothetical protein INR49_011212, partial [Caranx melampygus]
MQLEALQLFLLVRRLSKVQVIQRDGLPRPILYLIGYGVPFVIVGVSALVYSDGYGATEAEVLRPTLANMKSDVSQSKDTSPLHFLNSQQGTFLFIVHCLFNKEVREEYIKWLTCSFNKRRDNGSVKDDEPSVSEDLDKDQTGKRKKGGEEG